MNYALIGCGRVSFCHIEAAIKNDLNIVALCDIDLKKAEDTAKKYNLKAKLYDNYHDMIREEALDLIAIATDHDLHAKIALDVIENGINVIIEKPIALSLSEADQIIAKAKEKNVKLTVCHQNRFNKPIQRVRQELEAGKFGKLFYATAHARWNRSEDYYDLADWRGTWRGEGGSLITQCIHSIDLLVWMLGDRPTEVFAYTDRKNHQNIEIDDVAFGIVKFQNGSYGVIESTTNVYPENLEGSMYIFGEKGTVKTGGKANNHIDVWKFKDCEEDAEKIIADNNEEPPTVYGFGHQRLYSDMIDCIHSGKKPYITGEDGKRALALIFAMYLSSKEGRPVKLPLDSCASTDFEGLY